MSDVQNSDSVPQGFERILQQIELEDRRVATPFILAQAATLEDLVDPKDNVTTLDSPIQGIHHTHKAAAPAKPTAEVQDRESPPTGIHSLTQSVTDETSRRISGVDDVLFDQMDESLRRLSRGSTIRSPQEDDEGSQRSAVDDEVSEGYEQFRQPSSEEISGSNSPRKDGLGEFREDQELSQPSHVGSHNVEAKSEGSQDPQSSDSEVESSKPISESEKTGSSTSEVDTVSYLEQLAAAALEEDEATVQARLDSEMSVFYPQQLTPDEVTNPFTLEDRIRKAREDQDFVLQWEQGTSAGAMLNTNVIDDSRILKSEQGSSITELKDIYPDEATDSSERGFQPPSLSSELKERRRTESPIAESPDEKLPKRKTGAGEAVVVGALASGVNEPTWFAMRGVLVALVVSLVLLLHVAIQSASWIVLLHVLILIAIASGLIILLSWYISETGLVSVEKQMEELNLNTQEHDTKAL